MAKRKRKRTPAEKAARRARKAKYEWVLTNGKQKRVHREPSIDGLSVEKFLRRNADPLWLHQNEMWELMEPYGEALAADSAEE
jgi:hypothetical protein